MVVPLNGNINVLQSIPGAHVSAAGNECNGRAQINLPPFFCPLCQVRVYSGRGSGQVRMETDEGRGQRAGQEISPAGVGDRLDSTTKDNER